MRQKLILRWLINAVALYVAAELVPGIHTDGGWMALAVMAIIFGLVNALAGQLKLDAGRLSDFSELGGPFEIEGGRFLVRDWSFAGTDLTGVVGGSAGLGGSLDLDLELELPMETLERAGLIEGGGGGIVGNILGRLAGGDEAIQVGLGIGGTMSSPVLELDTEALGRELERRFGAAGRNLLQQLIKPPPR